MAAVAVNPFARPSIRFIACLAGAALAVSCVDATSAVRPQANFVLQPSFSREDAAIYRSLSLFNLSVTTLRLVLTRPNTTDTLKDTTLTIAPGQDSIVVKLKVAITGNEETLQAAMEMRSGTTLIFSGTANVIAKAAATGIADSPAAIVAKWVGPGVEAKKIVISPHDLSIVANNGSVAFSATAYDVNNAVVSNVDYQSRWLWHVIDTTFGTIPLHGGSFVASGKLGVALVTVFTPNLLQDTAKVTLLAQPPVATFLVEAAGGGAIPQQTAGTSFNIQITARDANNNTVPSFTGASSTVSLTSTGVIPGAPITSAAFTNGVLASQPVTITNTGSFTITASGAGGKTGTSAAFTVVAGAGAAAQSTATVPAGTAGLLTTITVQTRDANGNLRTTSSGTVATTVGGANSGAATSVTDNANGTYTITYTPTVAGTDAITITLGGTAIGGSPYSSVVSAGALANFLVEAAGTGPIPQQTVATSFNIRITARDANNNTVTSFNGGTNTVSLTSTGTLTGAPITTAAFTNGVLASQPVTITNTGSFTITASGSSKTGTSNAFTVVVGPPSPAQSTASVPAGTAGSLTTITVQAKDANGYNRTTTSGAVTASVGGANAGKLAAVTDNANGTYTITYTPTVAGTDQITITLGGTAIGGSPFSSIVSPAALATIRFAQQFTVFDRATTTTVAATPKDAYGNTITNANVSYTSRNTAVATVSNTGTITGVAKGQAVIVTQASAPSTPSTVVVDSLLAVVAEPGGVALFSSINRFEYPHDTTMTVSVFVDMRSSAKNLGSTTIDVTWNPAQLIYQSYANSATSGVVPIVNPSLTSSTLRLAMADVTGFSGKIEMLRITFKTASTAQTGQLALSASEMTASDLTTNLLLTLVQVSHPLFTH